MFWPLWPPRLNIKSVSASRFLKWEWNTCPKILKIKNPEKTFHPEKSPRIVWKKDMMIVFWKDSFLHGVQIQVTIQNRSKKEAWHTRCWGSLGVAWASFVQRLPWTPRRSSPCGPWQSPRRWLPGTRKKRRSGRWKRKRNNFLSNLPKSRNNHLSLFKWSSGTSASSVANLTVSLQNCSSWSNVQGEHKKGPLKGVVSTQKAFQGSETERREELLWVAPSDEGQSIFKVNHISYFSVSYFLSLATSLPWNLEWSCLGHPQPSFCNSVARKENGPVPLLHPEDHRSGVSGNGAVHRHGFPHGHNHLGPGPHRDPRSFIHPHPSRGRNWKQVFCA